MLMSTDPPAEAQPLYDSNLSYMCPQPLCASLLMGGRRAAEAHGDLIGPAGSRRQLVKDSHSRVQGVFSLRGCASNIDDKRRGLFG